MFAPQLVECVQQAERQTVVVRICHYFK